MAIPIPSGDLPENRDVFANRPELWERIKRAVLSVADKPVVYPHRPTQGKRRGKTSTPPKRTDPPDMPPPLPLWNIDLANLRASGLTDETIRANGLRTETAANLRALGFVCKSDGLLFPYRDLDGTPANFQRVRPHRPRLDDNGKEIKYESPLGSSVQA